jgi:hypothetical protein
MIRGTHENVRRGRRGAENQRVTAGRIADYPDRDATPLREERQRRDERRDEQSGSCFPPGCFTLRNYVGQNSARRLRSIQPERAQELLYGSRLS